MIPARAKDPMPANVIIADVHPTNSQLRENGAVMNTRKIPLNVVVAPASGAVLEAPPVLIASEHSVGS